MQNNLEQPEDICKDKACEKAFSQHVEFSGQASAYGDDVLQEKIVSEINIDISDKDDSAQNDYEKEKPLDANDTLLTNVQGSKTGDKFGKFESAQALYDAYNSLQAEFTRKCQKLKRLEKFLQDRKNSAASFNQTNKKVSSDSSAQENGYNKNSDAFVEQNIKIENEQVCQNHLSEVGDTLSSDSNDVLQSNENIDNSVGYEESNKNASNKDLENENLSDIKYSTVANHALNKDVKNQKENNDVVGQEEQVESDSAPLEQNDIKTKQQSEYYYMQSHFKQDVINFLLSNPDAKHLSQEISKALIENPQCTIYEAYEKVKAKMYREPQEIVSDNEFIEKYVLNSDKIKDMLISKYIKEAKNNLSPSLLSGNSAKRHSDAVDVQIGSLDEAKALAYKLFKNQ